jgi:hypothetical protein
MWPHRANTGDDGRQEGEVPVVRLGIRDPGCRTDAFGEINSETTNGKRPSRIPAVGGPAGFAVANLRANGARAESAVCGGTWGRPRGPRGVRLRSLR